MKIRNDLLKVYVGPAPGGEKVEPEARPVQQHVDMPAQVTGSLNGQNLGQLRTEVVVEGSVAQAALSERWKCKNCVHWNRKEWLRLYRQLNDPTASKTARQYLNDLRGGLLMTQNAQLTEAHTGEDGEFDVEHALQVMGWCAVLNALWKRDLTNFIITHPQACCPREVQTVQAPQGYWEPNEKERRLQQNLGYDKIMKTAQTGRPQG
jgi:hypothetical protein